MIKLSDNDITYAAQDVIDKQGRVFYWNSEVYRAIPKDKADLYRNLLNKKEFIDLMDKGLIKTSIADIKLEGYELILKHEKIPFISYVTEWSGSMLKEAALLTIDINISLLDLNLQLKDAHPWNVLFNGCYAVYIDFSSIITKRPIKNWFPMNEFWGKFYLPLLLMSYSCSKEARTLLVDAKTLKGRDLTRWDVFKTLFRRKKLKEILKFIFDSRPIVWIRPKEILVKLKKRINSINITFERTNWSNYCDEEVDFSKFESWMTKRKETYFALKRVQPKTLIDIGSNTGWFSKLAALNGSSVIAIDNDEPSINKLFLNKNARTLKILPLSMDFRFPTTEYGLGLRCPNAISRFKSEMALALALVHHLVFKQNFNFEHITKMLAAYTSRWLLVEFIPRDDIYVSKWYNEKFSWYTLENFIIELKKHFNEVEILPSNPEPRVLLLCTSKSD